MRMMGTSLSQKIDIPTTKTAAATTATTTEKNGDSS